MVGGLKVIHVSNDVGEASGVGTFVRRVNDELIRLGVDSSIITDTSTLRPPQPSQPLILHIHGLWLPVLHRAACWARAHHVPVVWSTHGMTAPWAMKHKWWKKGLPWWLYQKWDLKRANLIHCTSDFEVAWNDSLGLKQTCIVPLGTDLPEEREGRKVGGIKTLLFVGRIYPVKAIDRLIEAFALATGKSNNSPWHLRLVGPDQAGHMAELMSLCDRLNLPYSTPAQSNKQTIEQSNNFLVEFVGPKFGVDLSAEYENCACAALVSHTENFGATIVDAMAHGKPVIAGKKTPWKVVADRGCGFWVDNDPPTLAESIWEMMALSDGDRAEMGENGRKLVEEKYTWAAVGRAMLETYEKWYNVSMWRFSTDTESFDLMRTAKGPMPGVASSPSCLSPS